MNAFEFVPPAQTGEFEAWQVLQAEDEEYARRGGLPMRRARALPPRRPPRSPRWPVQGVPVFVPLPLVDEPARDDDAAAPEPAAAAPDAAGDAGDTPASELFEVAPRACARYEPGELLRSRSAAGHLAADVSMHPRGLLIADFGVDWRTPRATLARDPVLRDWLKTTLAVIRANPGTRLDVLGFSDCVGSERNNQLLRRGRAQKTLTLLARMLSSADWSLLKGKIASTAAAPAGDYVADNASIDGRARNRGVLITSTRRIDFAPQTVTACLVKPDQAARVPLLRLLPNVPDYKGHLPLDYRLDAKKMVGQTAQDISSLGPRAHVLVDGLHLGIAAVEMFELIAATGTLAAVLTVLGPVLALAGVFLALGAGYAEAAEKIAHEWSASGYSRGLVVGADGRKARQLKAWFGAACCPPNPAFPKGRDVAIANYRLGLLVGYLHGRLLCPNQRAIFWRELGRRMGDQSHRGPSKSWTERGWVNWYLDAAATFRAAHLH